MMANYKEKYDLFKAQVDAKVGHSLGFWGKIRALKDPNDLTAARKQAIDAVEKSNKLYQPENIIGTTGAKGQKPTVYYRSNSGTFGHITQEHNEPTNVGREPPRKDPNYKIENTGRGGRAEEKIGNKVFHPSRNPFREFKDLSDDEQQKARSVHGDFQHTKEIAKKYRW